MILRAFLCIWFLRSLAARLARPQLQARTELTPSFPKTVEPFLAENCVLCHNAKLKDRGLECWMPTTTRTPWSRIETSAENVLVKLRSEAECLPRARSRLKPPGELQAVERGVDPNGAWPGADRNVKPDPGSVTAHRLNRVEYNNTVRDLLAVDFHPADDLSGRRCRLRVRQHRGRADALPDADGKVPGRGRPKITEGGFRRPGHQAQQPALQSGSPGSGRSCQTLEHGSAAHVSGGCRVRDPQRLPGPARRLDPSPCR